MKKFLFTFLFAPFFMSGQWNQTSHRQYNFAIEPNINFGSRNVGGGLMVGYYIDDYMQIRGGGSYKSFEYKTYKEAILEANLDFLYTVHTPRYRDDFFSNWNIAGIGGVAVEQVKVKSRTQLIDPYPKYFYFYLGGQAEYMLSDNWGLLTHLKQYYALNGSKEKIGNWRYEIGVSVRYYLWR
ncbi:hypothetical protein [Riemerella anatipestifer]|uniref:hypothetical protein n=1 Tax=Riemerella anatipestifer TaxID=34085 RepID=UPI00129ECBA6|nr:hypothetical protein [Riemerella anatipestifer]